MRILIWGAGHFGQALGHVFRGADHDVLMYIRNIEKAERASACFGKDAVTYHSPDASDFDHVFITTDTAGLLPALEDIGQAKRPGTCLWLVQKGNIPRGLFWNEDWAGVHYLTGAAFSSCLLAGKVVGMVVSARTEHWRPDGPAADLIRSVEQIRGTYWYNPVHIVGMNRLRTIGSLQRGITDEVLAYSPSTRAMAIASIEAEAHILALKLGYRPLTQGVVANSSQVLRVLKADEELCSSEGSRNYRAGRLIGRGVYERDHLWRIATSQGVVESVANVHSLCAELGEQYLGFPYLSRTKRILDGELTAKQAQAELEARTEGWL